MYENEFLVTRADRRGANAATGGFDASAVSVRTLGIFTVTGYIQQIECQQTCFRRKCCSVMRVWVNVNLFPRRRGAAAWQTVIDSTCRNQAILKHLPRCVLDKSRRAAHNHRVMAIDATRSPEFSFAVGPSRRSSSMQTATKPRNAPN